MYNIARGIDKDPVQVKLISKSIGCCKRFPGRNSLCKTDEVEHWMKELSSEISDRLEEDLKENNRKGKLMTVSFSQETNQTEISSTRAVPLKSYEMEKIWQQALEVLKKYCQKPDGSYHITFLGLSIGNFEDFKNVKTITSYFKKVDKKIPNNTKIDNIKDDFQNDLPHSKTTESSTVTPETDFQDFNVKNRDSNNFSGDSDYDNKSVYSDTTIEFEENVDEIMFYNDHTKSEILSNTENHEVTNRKESINKNEKVNSGTSIIPTLENSVEERQSAEDFSVSDSPVLRSRMHVDVDDDGDTSTEIQRNFDTSKIFGEHYDSSDEENESIVFEETRNAELSENCKECGELIPLLEIVSHMDYHLALKLSQEIEPSIMEVAETKQRINDKPPPKKRKVSNYLGSIQSFCTKQNIESDEITELCTECNKRIKIDDITTHYDYHAAKKLHLELNSPSSKSETLNNKNPIASSTGASVSRKNKKINSGVNIASFFKRDS